MTNLHVSLNNPNGVRIDHPDQPGAYYRITPARVVDKYLYQWETEKPFLIFYLQSRVDASKGCKHENCDAYGNSEKFGV